MSIIIGEDKSHQNAKKKTKIVSRRLKIHNYSDSGSI